MRPTEEDYLRANFMTLGNLVIGLVDRGTLTGIHSNEQFEDLGRKVWKRIHPGLEETRELTDYLVREMHVGMNYHIVLKAIEVLFEELESFVTKPLKLTNAQGKVYATVRFFKKPSEEFLKTEAFYIKDFSGYADSFMCLESLVSLESRKGKAFLQKILSTVNVPVILQAGFLFYGDYAIWESGVDLDSIEKLTKFYEDLGFTNVNSLIGGYENSNVMLYSKDEALNGKIQSITKKMNAF